MLKLRLTKHKNINEAKTFEQHDPTHPDYPDFVSGYCYRLRDGNYYASVLFVLPRSIKYDDLGFNVDLVTNQACIEGFQLSFLDKKDAENFAAKYLGGNLTTYISQNSVRAVRIDNYSDIPCYVDITWVPGVTRTGSLLAKGRPERISPNLFNRLKKTPHTYKENPFISQDDVLSNIANNNLKLMNIIDEKLELMREVCSDITILVDYKDPSVSTTRKLIAKGIVDKKITAISNWIDADDNKSITAKIRTYSEDEVELYLNVSYTYFDINKLEDNLKNLFNDHLFCTILEEELELLPHRGNIAEFRLEENTIYLRFRIIKIIKSADFDPLNEIFITITNDVKEAINNAADRFIKTSFTIDDFDEE